MELARIDIMMLHPPHSAVVPIVEPPVLAFSTPIIPIPQEPKHSNCSVKQQNAINLSLFKSQERMEVFKESFLATYINENG